MPKSSEKLFITVDAELAAQLREYQRSLGLENLPETVRVLLRQQIAATPWDAPALQLAREGLNSVRHWAFTRFREKLSEIEREMDEARE